MQKQPLKYATVEVIKGRKVAVGTIGRIFWIADGQDKWGVLSIGIVTQDNQKHFVDAENVIEIRSVENAEGYGVEMWGSNKRNWGMFYEFAETLYDAYVIGGKFSDKNKFYNNYRVFKVVK